MSTNKNLKTTDPRITMLERLAGYCAYTIFAHKFDNPDPDPEIVQQQIDNIENLCRGIHDLKHQKQVIASNYVDLDLGGGSL